MQPLSIMNFPISDIPIVPLSSCAVWSADSCLLPPLPSTALGHGRCSAAARFPSFDSLLAFREQLNLTISSFIKHEARGEKIEYRNRNHYQDSAGIIWRKLFLCRSETECSAHAVCLRGRRKWAELSGRRGLWMLIFFLLFTTFNLIKQCTQF